jgi:hypothetical protein
LEPIQITPVSEKLFSRTPERGGGYLEITERIGVDQYGRQWHSFHSRIVFDPVETSAGDKPAVFSAKNPRVIASK